MLWFSAFFRHRATVFVPLESSAALPFLGHLIDENHNVGLTGPSGLAGYREISFSVVCCLLPGCHDSPLPVNTFSDNLKVPTLPRLSPPPPFPYRASSQPCQPGGHNGPIAQWIAGVGEATGANSVCYAGTACFCFTFQKGAVSVPGLGMLPAGAVTWSCLLPGHSHGLTSHAGFIGNSPKFFLIF